MVTAKSRLERAQLVEKRRRVTPAARREQLRDTLWPNADDLVWDRRTTKGFTTIPRVLPLVTTLIKELVPKGGGDPSSVYIELWARVFDEGMLTINDESEHAYCSGYKGTRAVRTWRERILTLAELGFISYKPNGNREVGHILLLNPLGVCNRLHEQGRVPEEWWSMFAKRISEIGATIPKGWEK